MKQWKKWIREYATMLIIWLGVLGLFSLLSDRFLTMATFSSLASQIPTLTVIAAGMTFVIIVAGIDLSVGSVMGMAGAVFGACLVHAQLPMAACILIALAAAAAAGAINGLISVHLRVPSFIVTLGMLEIARGLSYTATGSQTMYLSGALSGLALPVKGLGLPASFFIAISIVIVLQLILSRTLLGRRLIAVGTNERAVHLAGVNSKRPQLLVFILCGFLAGVGALFYTARLGSADPNAGVGLELSAIAAVVIGGTSLMGGRGSVINTFLGVLIIATLETGLAQVGASEPVKRIITGAVIVGAAIIDAWRNQIPGGLIGYFKRISR